MYIYARNIFWDYESRSMRSRRRKRLLTTRFTEFHGSRGGERKDWRARLVRTDENSERRSEKERIRAVLVVAIRWRRAKKWLIVTLSAICVLLPLQMTDPYRFCYGNRRNDRVKDRARDSGEGKGRWKKEGNFFRGAERGGNVPRRVASDRSESSIRLDSPPCPCYFIFRAINVIG